MKHLFAIIFIAISLNIFATETENPCPMMCRKNGFAMPSHRDLICWEPQLCVIFKLNEETNECEFVEEIPMRMPILCRDVPPAY